MSLTGFFSRGFKQSYHPRAAEALPMFRARVSRLRSEGFGLGDDQPFLAAQAEFHRLVAAEQMAELDGIAQGFDVAFEDIWLHLHAGTLADFRGGAVLDDGCSAFASGKGPEGPLLVKNRDLGAKIELVQVAQRHEESATGGLLVIGSLLAPSAYSSGMNRAGLALVDTHVGSSRHRVGWLRYMLMGHILESCMDVAEALDLLSSVPHCGGGTIELVDRQGNSAAVELAASGAAIEAGAPSGMHYRSNHWLLAGTSSQTLVYRSPLAFPNSQNRLTALASLALAHPNGLTSEAAKRAFSSHGIAKDPSDINAEGRGLCQHHQSRTLSCAIWSPVQSSLEWTDGSPCSTAWERLTL